jgi:hypothetical protein
MISKWANRVLFFCNAVVLAVAVLYFGLHPLKSGIESIESKDLITIVLGAVAVLLAAVTIFIAVLAIWGYNSIREESVKAAVAAAEKEARNTAEAVASRESVTMLGVVKNKKDPENDDELANALHADAEPDPREPG